jgi:hypothetical protein
MVGDDRDIRNRVARVVAQLRQISEGSGRINARDTWLTVTLAIAELESLLTILRRSFLDGEALSPSRLPSRWHKTC